MKKIALIVGILIFAGIGFVGCYTIKADVLPADYKGPAAERPILAPGDYWIYVQKDGGEVEWKFIRQEGDELVFEGGKPRDKKRKDTLYTNLDLIP